jgi:transposase
MLKVSPEELNNLESAMRSGAKAHLRRKATALWNLAQGRSQREVAAFLGASRTSIIQWKRRFEAEGLAGLELRPGRGRPQRAELAEIEVVLRQSPRNFGIPQTRWTLEALAQAAPSLHGFTPSGVWRVLQRGSLGYKRGQPLIHSPDPAYAQKRGPSDSASRSRKESRRDSSAVYG